MSETQARSDTSKLYVQYGCGQCAPDAWTNFDSSPRLRIERLPGSSVVGRSIFPKNVMYGNIVEGLPIAEGTADAVYSSHVLEHLGRKEVPKALANTFKILKRGGIFRMIVPDLEWRARRYVKALDAGEPMAGDAFIEACNIGASHRKRGTAGLLRAAFGNSGHTWMYDYGTMKSLLTDAGFVDIRRCELGDSKDPMFDLVEDSRRFIDSGEALTPGVQRTFILQRSRMKRARHAD